MKKSLFVLLSLFLTNVLISTAPAHQPRIVYKQNISQTSPIIVINPEISQAYYAELKGQPEYYTVISDKEFNLYIRILSPKITEAKKDFSAEVIKDVNIIAVLNGYTHIWTEFYEPFVGDSSFFISAKSLFLKLTLLVFNWCKVGFSPFVEPQSCNLIALIIID